MPASARRSRRTRASGSRAPPARAPSRDRVASSLERAQQLVVAGAGLVRAGHDRVDDPQPRPGPMRPVAMPSPARTPSVRQRRVLERAHHRRADRDDAAAGEPRGVDRRGGRRRESGRARRAAARVERRVAGRRDARRRGSAWRTPRRDRAAAARWPSRARSRPTAARTPPAGWRSASRRHHSASGCGTCAYWIGRPCRAMPAQIASSDAVERQLDQPRMPEHALDVGVERAERQPIAGARAAAAAAGARCGVRGRRRRRRRRRSAARRCRASERRPARRTSIGRAASAACTPVRLAGSVAASLATTRSPAAQARQIARGAMARAAVAPTTSRRAARGAAAGRGHGATAMAARSRAPAVARTRASISSTISTAASSGRFSVARIGVGHGERVQRRVHVAGIDATTSMPMPTSSSRQMRVRCRSAALLAP